MNKVTYYFKNLYRALIGKTGFHLVGSKPDTWYAIKELSKDNALIGHILTDKSACFVPFIQCDATYTWDKPQN